MRRLAVVLLTCKAAFGCVDGAAQLEAVRRGLPTEAVAALAPPLLLASVALPLAAARWTAGPRPLSSAFLWGFRLRLALNPLTYVVLRCVEAAPASRRPRQEQFTFTKGMEWARSALSPFDGRQGDGVLSCCFVFVFITRKLLKS